MLKLRAMGVLVLFAGLSGAGLAAADQTVEAHCLKKDPFSPGCSVAGQVTEVSTKPGDSGHSGGSNTPRVCKTWTGSEVPCEKDGAIWFDSAQDYCRVQNPQPPKDHPVWHGRTTGAIWTCTFSDQLIGGMWQPSAEPVQPNPEVLARQAVAQLGLEAIQIGISPRTLETDPNSMGAVGLPVWMWVANPGPQTTESQSRTASENGWSVTISSRLRQVVWDMGDGSEKRFCATGTPYYPGAGVKDSPDCGYRYQKQGIYTVKATSQWEVTWSGLGHSGVIPLEFTTTGSVRIGEIQTVITKPKP